MSGDKDQQISGVEFGKLLNAVENLHGDVREIKTDVKSGFKAGNSRMTTLEIEQGKHKTAVKIIGAFVIALVAAVIKVFLS